MLRYDMSDMRGTDGLSLWYQVESALVDQVSAIQKKLQEDDHYLGLRRKLPSRHVEAYFKMAIRSDIYDAVREACVIDWYKKAKKAIPRHESSVRVPGTGIFRLLKECWLFDCIDLVLEDSVIYYLKRPSLVVSKAKEAARECLARMRWRRPFPKANEQVTARAKIGCHYTEGIHLDPNYRSDIEWTLPGGVDPKDVVLYVSDFDTLTGRPFSSNTIRRMEERGFGWVAIDPRAVEGGRNNLYLPSGKPDRRNLSDERTDAFSSRMWIQKIWNEMVKTAFYWRSFFTEFNIRVLFIPEYTTLTNVAQAIALDLEDNRSGVIVGVQRSEILDKVSRWDTCGFFHKHILFIWSNRTKDILFPNTDMIENTPLSGYPFRKIEKSHKRESASSIIRNNGARFVIALFDEAPAKNASKARQEIASFYRLFIEWMLEDKEVGIVIKSKKPMIQASLVKVSDLIRRAERTGRCINVRNSFGMKPMSVIEGVDMVVGFNISTAVIESVINGARGVMFDSEQLYGHQVYGWGDGSIVFKRLDAMIDALKGYKDDDSMYRGIGDWTAHIDEIDPFRDGQYHMRVARYMIWLLEAFDSGKGRNEAIEFADRQYAMDWPAVKGAKETVRV